MRRALLLGLGLTALLAAPAHAADETINGQANLEWDRRNVTVQPGDTVTWAFPDVTQVHNVKATGGANADPLWPSFRSELGRPAPPGSYTFNVEGTYDFVCEVHTSTMTGTVTVSTAPIAAATPTPTPPPSQQAFANDDAAPVTPEKVTFDESKPRLAAVSAKRIGRRARVRFRVSEQSVVTVRFKRGRRTVRTVETAADGLRGVTVRMRRGRYRVEVRAVDLAGNRSSLRIARVTVR
jgi:plastocyanin